MANGNRTYQVSGVRGPDGQITVFGHAATGVVKRQRLVAFYHSENDAHMAAQTAILAAIGG